MATYKLIYFDIKGRGELSRLILTAAGQAYEDHRIPYTIGMKDMKEWEELKPKTPFGQLPVLQVTENGKTTEIAQSLSVARFLAKRLGLAGSNDIEHAQVDMYADQVHDLLNEIARASFEKDEERKKSAMEKLETETFPKNLCIFETQLAKNGSGYLVGPGLTWADLYFFVVIDWVQEKLAPHLDKTPNIKKLVENVRNNEKIAEWLKKRPVTPL